MGRQGESRNTMMRMSPQPDTGEVLDRDSSGSLAIFAAIRRALSDVINSDDDAHEQMRQRHKSTSAAATLVCQLMVHVAIKGC